MRVVAVSDYFDLDHMGGATRVLWETARALRVAGHETLVVAGGEQAGEETRERTIIRRLAFRGRASGVAGAWRFRTGLARLVAGACRESAPAALWCHQPLAGDVALAVGAHLRVPGVYGFHSPWPAEIAAEGRTGLGSVLGRLVRTRIERRTLRRAAHVVTESRAMAAEVIGRYGIPADRVTVNPGGFDPARFTPPADRALDRAALRCASDTRLVVTARRLTPRMGLEDLIDAAGALRREVPGLRVVIVGDGPLREALVARIAAAGLGGVVECVGRVSDDTLVRWLGAADLAVLPTRALEGFGLAAVEALACGTPVVATPVGGLPEILRDLEPGLLATATGPEALAATLRRWLGDPAGCTALRPRCAAYSRERYTWARAAETLAGIVARVSTRQAGRA